MADVIRHFQFTGQERAATAGGEQDNETTIDTWPALIRQVADAGANLLDGSSIKGRKRPR